MNTARRTILGAGVALALSAGLAGCSGSPVPTMAVGETGSATPTAAALATGDVLDAAQVDVILKAGHGQRAYPMSDGTFVAVTKTEPLPAVVQADANAKAAAAVAAAPIAASMEAYDSRANAAGDVAIGTGKRVLAVWGIFGYPDSMSESKSTFWTVTGGASSDGTVYLSRAEADAVVDAYISASDSPGDYVVIHSD